MTPQECADVLRKYEAAEAQRVAAREHLQRLEATMEAARNRLYDADSEAGKLHGDALQALRDVGLLFAPFDALTEAVVFRSAVGLASRPIWVQAQTKGDTSKMANVPVVPIGQCIKCKELRQPCNGWGEEGAICSAVRLDKAIENNAKIRNVVYDTPVIGACMFCKHHARPCSNALSPGEVCKNVSVVPK